MTQTLQEAQETNKRLNRRLAALEAPLHRQIQEALNHAEGFQRRLGWAQDRAAEQAKRADYWYTEYTKIAHAEPSYLVRGRWWWRLILWAALATAACIYLVVRGGR